MHLLPSTAAALALLAVITFCHGTLATSPVWPQPLDITSTDRLFYFRRGHHFRWEAPRRESMLLTEAFQRYNKIIREASAPVSWPDNAAENTQQTILRSLDKHAAIESVEVHVVSSDQSLGLQTSETYSLRVSAPTTIITATTVYGALRGLETLAQLASTIKVDESLLDSLDHVVVEAAVAADLDRHHKHHHRHKKHHHPRHLIVINETAVFDTPRFSWRGLLIDTARHFLPLDVIKTHLDAMAMSKLNVLHWHLVDDQSFPYGSQRLPELSEAGTFSPSMKYSKSDVAEVVAYARSRGIRVLPEFDTPGHVSSWGYSHPELLTRCFDRHGKPTGLLGPIDVSKEEIYTLLWQLLKEAAGWFSETFIHLGGDEVDTACWESNADVRNWAKQQNLSMSQLQAYHTQRMIKLATAAGKHSVLWQEAAEAASLASLSANKTIIQVWKWDETLGKTDANTASNSDKHQQQRHRLLMERHQEPSNTVLATHFSLSAAANFGDKISSSTQQPLEVRKQSYWQTELARITKTHNVILSAPWYLDHAEPSQHQWEAYWTVNPTDFKGSEEQKERVLGGEACIWGELVDETNSIAKTWPLAAAVGESLWSEGGRDTEGAAAVDEARRRLEKLRCRMLLRGVDAAPLGPGYCPEL